MSDTYVYENTEVKKTGRIAKKESKLYKRSERTPTRIDILHEITPVDDEIGTWKKWVRDEDLYEILQGKNNDKKISRSSVPATSSEDSE